MAAKLKLDLYALVGVYVLPVIVLKVDRDNCQGRDRAFLLKNSV